MQGKHTRQGIAIAVAFLLLALLFAASSSSWPGLMSDSSSAVAVSNAASSSSSSAAPIAAIPKFQLPGADAWSQCAQKYEEASSSVTSPHARWLLNWALEQAKAAGQKDLTLADIACGTGALSLAAAARPDVIASVLASDFSAGMLERVELHASALAAPKAPLRTLVSDAGDLKGIPSNSVDIASCIFGIMLLPDPLAATKELVRITKPGGLILFATWAPMQSQMHGVMMNAMKYVNTKLAEEKKAAEGGNAKEAPTAATAAAAPAPAAPVGGEAPKPPMPNLRTLPYSQVNQFTELFGSLGLEALLLRPHEEQTRRYDNIRDWWAGLCGAAPMFNQEAAGERGMELVEEWAAGVWGAQAPFALTSTSIVAVARKPLL
jgi:ubiquinone/menaquinone biosynthesis C-methylase UbiE